MTERLYESIAEHVVRQILGGALRTGARVASVRTLSAQFKVSTNTVLHAFATLEARGFVEARPKSGYYVLPIATPGLEVPRPPSSRPPSVPRSLGDRLPGFFHSMRDPTIIPFGAACPSPELLPGERLARVVGQVARMAGSRALGYDALPGHAFLRREIARRLSRAGCSVTAEEIITTVGAVEALHLALRATTKRRDAVLVESPCYFGVLQLLSELELRAVEIPADAESGMQLNRVEKALRGRTIRACVVVPNFANPLGSLMPLQAKRDLVDLCRKRDVAIVESDVYSELPFEGERPVPLKALDRWGIVLHCSSFSKTMAPGFRVGWICPGTHFERVEQTKFTHTVATPTITQAAVAEFLANGGYDRHLRTLRRALRDQVRQAREAIARHFPVGTRVSDPQGGFLLWVQLPTKTVDAVELQRRALRNGISIVPGPLFSAQGGFSDCFRISCGHPWSPAFDRAIVTLGRLCRT